MKKLMFAALVFGSVSFLVACKKDHVCSCDGMVFGIPFTDADTTFTDMSKKDAESQCNSMDFSFGTDNYMECELK